MILHFLQGYDDIPKEIPDSDAKKVRDKLYLCNTQISNK